LDALLQPIFLIILNMKSKITIHHLPTHTSWILHPRFQISWKI
jgi:hypothetical protein